MKKCSAAPRIAVLIPPWNESRPSSPAATDCKTLAGRTPAWKCHATIAWVMSRTPQARPPQKMARKAEDELGEDGFMLDFCSFDGDYTDKRERQTIKAAIASARRGKAMSQTI